MTETSKKWLITITLVLVVGFLGFAGWQKIFKGSETKDLASGNGRIEAVEINIAAKTPGRLKKILVREGDLVTAGQIVAVMDIDSLEAQHRQAEAQLQQARSSVETADSQLVQRKSEKAAERALVDQREAELDVARKRSARSTTLASEGATSQQEADDNLAGVRSSEAAVSAARAQLAAAEAAVTTARAQISGAQSAVKAAQATVERIEADIKDCTLVSPR